jgi:5-(carboxyamino)imidazole ribonucleotide mutase
MPAGIPVATVAIGNSHNAALLAVRILSTCNQDLAHKLEQHANDMKDLVAQMNKELN